MTLLRFALRNVVRNLRRSVLTALAMAAGLFVLIFVKGVTDGYVDRQIESALGTSLGHVVARAPEGGAIADGAAAARGLESDPDVVAAAPRIRFEGFAKGVGGAVGAVLLGVDAESEARATRLPRSIVEGAFLPPPAKGEAPPAALGAGLARRLDVAVEDRVTLLVEGGDGAMVAEVFRVAGVFRTGDETFDAAAMYVPRDDARRMLLLDGDATEVVARVRDPLRAEEAAARAAAAPALAGLSVENWRESVPELRRAIEMLHALEFLRSVMLFTLVGLGIFNTAMMSLYERRREFGVLLAVGMRPGAVLRCLVLEIAVIAAHAVLLGVAVGVGVTQAWYGTRGIDLSGLGAHLPGAVPGASVIYPIVRPDNLVAAGVWIAATSLAVLVVPGWRLLRMDPAEALRDRN
jgi:ABC-type lipoprotein release transport system permease subunit